MRKAYADTPLGQVHYRDGGAGRPLLMLHESPWSSAQFEPVWPLLLAAGFRPLAMDTPGFGMSDTPAAEPTIEDYASVVPYVLDHAGVGVADMVGHHTGAAIAIEAVARFPDRFRKLVAHGVPLLSPDEAREWRARVVEPARQGLALHADGSHLARRFAAYAAGGAALGSAQRKTVASLLAGDRWWYGHNATFSYRLEPRLRQLRLPLLFLSNTGELIGDKTLRAHEVRPDAQIVDIPCRPGAIVIDEDPHAWVAAVVAFLNG